MTIELIAGPTLANPDSLESVPELRRELHRANETLIRQFRDLSLANAAGTQLAGEMDAVLRAHIQGDTQLVTDRLEAYLIERPKLREHLEEQIESDQIRRVH